MAWCLRTTWPTNCVPLFTKPEGGCTVRQLLTKLRLALRSSKGQSLVEYALILALVAIVVIVALTALGGQASDSMGNVANTIGTVT